MYNDMRMVTIKQDWEIIGSQSTTYLRITCYISYKKGGAIPMTNDQNLTTAQRRSESLKRYWNQLSAEGRKKSLDQNLAILRNKVSSRAFNDYRSTTYYEETSYTM